MTSKILVGGEEISKFEMNTDDLKNPGDIKMWVRYLGQEDPQRRAWQPTPVFVLGESH